VELALLGNKDALVGALGNLVANSLQAKPQGAVLSISAHAAIDGHIELRLRDNGPGIPAELRAHIFDPFFTTRPGGTGLGLAVVQATVRAHRGSVHVEAPAGGGSEFILRLPTATAVAALPDSECLNYLTTAASVRHAVCGIN
jgi:two-component system sensor histidine kinase FlrB